MPENSNGNSNIIIPIRELYTEVRETNNKITRVENKVDNLIRDRDESNTELEAVRTSLGKLQTQVAAHNVLFIIGTGILTAITTGLLK